MDFGSEERQRLLVNSPALRLKVCGFESQTRWTTVKIYQRFPEFLQADFYILSRPYVVLRELIISSLQLIIQ